MTERRRGWHSRGYLPHFDSPVHTQHVTVHLADSLPKSAVERIDQIIDWLPEKERQVERRRRLHEWIDAGHGSCLLSEPELARLVASAFRYFDGERYRLFEWVVMPNHFHVLFQPIDDWSMAEIVASWKKFTATEIKKWLGANAEIRDPGNATLPSCSASGEGANAEIRDPGNATLPSCSASGEGANAEIRDPGSATRSGWSGPLWHPEYWDRFVRNEKHFRDVTAYIHNNPVKAGLCKNPEAWRFGSAFEK